MPREIPERFIALMRQAAAMDLRMGQFFYNVFCTMTAAGRDPFFPENDELAEWMAKYLESGFAQTAEENTDGEATDGKGCS